MNVPYLRKTFFLILFLEYVKTKYVLAGVSWHNRESVLLLRVGIQMKLPMHMWQLKPATSTFQNLFNYENWTRKRI